MASTAHGCVNIGLSRMTSPKPIEFLEPWEPFTSEQAHVFLHELEIELASGHGLHGVRLTALGHSGAADDALFQMEDGGVVQVGNPGQGERDSGMMPNGIPG